MGDRTYATFQLGGHVETIEEIQNLCTAIVCEGVFDNEDHSRMSSKEDVQSHLRFCVEQSAPPKFFDHEVNYGNFESIEAAVDEIPGLGGHFTWESGGDYGAGMKTIMPNNEVYVAEGSDGANIALHAIKSALAGDDPITAITELAAKASKAEGDDLPPFTVSPAVAAYLKIFADKAA